jgi:hypothetical protein
LPQSGGPHALQYDCHRNGHGQSLCRINYFFGSSGKYKNRLIGAVLGGGALFHTRNGTRIGTGERASRQREHKAIAASFCGQPVLRYPPAHSTPNSPYAGLNIGFYRGKVGGFLILSPQAKVSCLPGGAYSIG